MSSQFLKLFFTKLPADILNAMILKFGIKNYNPDYLHYSKVITDNILIYQNLILKNKMKYGRYGNEVLFYISTKNMKCFFRTSYNEINIDNYIDELVESEDFSYRFDLESIKRRIETFKIQEIFDLMYFDKEIFLSLDKVEEKNQSKQLRHSLLRDSTTETIFFISGPPELFLEDIFFRNVTSNIFYVYLKDDVIGINKMVYTHSKQDGSAFKITKKDFDLILEFFRNLRDQETLDVMSIRMVFFTFIKTPILKFVLEKCFENRWSADFIVVLHLLKYAGLVSFEEFYNLMMYKTNQIWELQIYKEIVKLVIDIVTNKPTLELMSSKCALFQYFIIKKMCKIRDHERVVADSKVGEKLLDGLQFCAEIADFITRSYSLYNNTLVMVEELIFRIQKGVKKTFTVTDNAWFYPDPLIQISPLDFTLEGMKYNKARDKLRDKLKLDQDYGRPLIQRVKKFFEE